MKFENVGQVMLEKYRRAHKRQMDVIRRYQEGTLSHYAYTDLYDKYETEKQTLAPLMNMMSDALQSARLNK